MKATDTGSCLKGMSLAALSNPVRRGFGVFTILSLVGCAPTQAPLRDPVAPLSATTRFDAKRFAGDWYVAASTADNLKGSIAVQANREGDALVLIGALSGVYDVEKPGVLAAPDGSILVVMWLDEAVRTAALGDADGRFAVLLSRARSVPADKRTAAYGVFDFYGWDTSRIEEIK